jgi:hypothetical protein
MQQVNDVLFSGIYIFVGDACLNFRTYVLSKVLDVIVIPTWFKDLSILTKLWVHYLCTRLWEKRRRKRSLAEKLIRSI